MAVESAVQALGACAFDARGQRLQIGRVVQAAESLRFLEEFLPEPRHFARRMGLIERDHVGQALNLRLWRVGLQPHPQVMLQLVEQHLEFGIAIAGWQQAGVVNDGGAEFPKFANGHFNDGIGLVMAREVGARHAQAHALQGVGAQTFVVGLRRRRLLRDRVIGIGAHQGRIQQRSVGDGARHRACGVLAVCDGNDTRAADAPECRLQPHQAVDGGGRDDAAVGLGAHAQSAQAGGDGRAGARTAAAGAAVQRVGVACQAAAGTPAAGAARAADVGPLAEVGLAQHHRTAFAQALHQVGVTHGAHAFQRQRSGAGAHLVGSGDVVLQQHGQAVQRATQLAIAALGITFARNGQRIGVHLDDAVQPGAAAVQRFDACGVALHQRLGGGAPRQQRLRELRRTGFLQVGQGRRGGGRTRHGRSFQGENAGRGGEQGATFHVCR